MVSNTMNTIQPPWCGLQAPHALAPHISPTLSPLLSLLLITHCCKHHSFSAFSKMPSLFPAQSLCLCTENGRGGLVAKSCPTVATPWTVARQPLLSIRFSRQENWSGLPFSSPGDLTNLGIELGSPGKVRAREWSSQTFSFMAPSYP